MKIGGRADRANVGSGAAKTVQHKPTVGPQGKSNKKGLLKIVYQRWKREEEEESRARSSKLDRLLLGSVSIKVGFNEMRWCMTLAPPTLNNPTLLPMHLRLHPSRTHSHCFLQSSTLHVSARGPPVHRANKRPTQVHPNFPIWLKVVKSIQPCGGPRGKSIVSSKFFQWSVACVKTSSSFQLFQSCIQRIVALWGHHQS